MQFVMHPGQFISIISKILCIFVVIVFVVYTNRHIIRFGINIITILVQYEQTNFTV